MNRELFDAQEASKKIADDEWGGRRGGSIGFLFDYDSLT
jgi:hypothetical protein